jgi:hypothetical protein
MRDIAYKKNKKPPPGMRDLTNLHPAERVF